MRSEAGHCTEADLFGAAGHVSDAQGAAHPFAKGDVLDHDRSPFCGRSDQSITAAPLVRGGTMWSRVRAPQRDGRLASDDMLVKAVWLE